MRVRLVATLVIALAMLSGPAFAQLGGLGLPNTQLPTLPGVGQDVRGISGAPEPVENAVRGLPQTTGAQVRSLLRQHRDAIDRDAQGFPIVRGEVLAIAPSGAALSEAQAA